LEATSGTLRRDGGKLAWSSTGDGPPVVLVHGFTLTREMWDDVTPALSEDHRVICYDCRGFGASGAPDPDVPYSHTSDLLDLLDHLEITSAALVGQSFGGQIALSVAIVAPERVTSLVLVDSVLDGVPWDEESQKGMELIGVRLDAEGLDGARAAWLSHPFFRHANKDPELAARLSAMVSTYPGHHWTGKDPCLPYDPPIVDALDRVTAPTTVIVGSSRCPDLLRCRAC
jgi:pimeloyl-ACP methyl ester carboxylesterase